MSGHSPALLLPHSLSIYLYKRKQGLRRSQSSCFSYFSLFNFFSLVECWNFSVYLDFHKSSLGCRWLPQSVFSKCCQTNAERHCNWFTGSCDALQSVSRSVCLLPDAQVVQPLPGSLVYSAAFHTYNCQRGTFIHRWMLNFWWDDQTRDIFCHHDGVTWCWYRSKNKLVV